MIFRNCSVFCCAVLCVHSSFAIISMGNSTAALRYGSTEGTYEKKYLESWLICFVCLSSVSFLLCGSSSRCHGPKGGVGGTLMFSYIRRLRPFLGFKILNFNILGFFAEK